MVDDNVNTGGSNKEFRNVLHLMLTLDVVFGEEIDENRYRAKNLWNNNISTIKEGVFTGLSNLKELNLRENNISTIKEGVFLGLSNLERLDLKWNNIATLKAGAFTGLSNLTYLTLSNNKFSRIEKEMFQGLHRLQKLDLQGSNIATIKEGTFTGLSNLKGLSLSSNKISRIEKEMFQGLHRLQKLNLWNNSISTIKEGTFTGLSNLKVLFLSSNKISRIEKEMFQGLHSLQKLYLDSNPIEKYEDGAFLFLHSIAEINLRNNNLMKCGCHLPAFVKDIKKVYNRNVAVSGACQEDSGKLIRILDYSQCQNYSLSQRNLQCQTCSGIICNDSKVTSCPEAEPVCRFAISMNGAKLKTERSCSTYRKCVAAMRNNTLTCNKRTNGTSCTGCCVGHLCNKNDFIGWTKSLVFRLIFKKFNEYKIPAENISRAMEHDLSTATGTFRVEDCGSNRNKIFAIYCTVFSEMTESQLRRNISQVLNKSQALLNLGVKKSHMKFLDEMVCDESTTSTNNRTFSWPMTKIGTTAEIPCHGNVATRHCSSRTMGHPEMASSQNLSSQKCSPFTGIWQEPDMSQCYNAEQTKGIDDGFTKSFAFRLILKTLNEYKIPAENISRAMEHEFLTVTGKFRVEYHGVQSQLRRNISQVLNKFQALLNMNLLDESSSTGNGTEDRTAETNF
ncbi:uncharacterized protein LOC115212327 [Octopus sinensis]|uniref:Uncharacterized protein LOC115212327 n=1 Tax=Octopus sinensis TaxID=2607531 RepID=A0A6P7SGF8_9MOLL|nr:uncharacterized protein LOC115212327 [Octopus sinensis]